MFDLLLRRARLVDDTLTDIAIQDGKIAALGEISAPSRKTIELNAKVYKRQRTETTEGKASA